MNKLASITTCLAVLLLSGCDTFSPGRLEAEQPRMAMEFDYLRHDVDRLKARSEDSIKHLELLEQQIEQQKLDQDRAQRLQREEIASLREEIAKLQGERDRLRREIVSELGDRIDRIMRERQPAAAAGREQVGYEHTVATGQTLSEIAKAYGVTVDVIIRANNISDPNRIREGQKLFIPE